MDTMEEREMHNLISQAIAGNRDAFGEIYDKTVSSVYQTVHFLLDNKSEIEDVIQEIYFGLHQSLPNFDTSRSFRPWLYGIVIKQLNSYRRKKWMWLRNIQKKAVQRLEDQEVDFSGDLIERLNYENLQEAINKLPYKLKQVIILHYLNEYTQEEIAEILAIPIGTVKSRIHSALKKLRESKGLSTTFFQKVGETHES